MYGVIFEVEIKADKKEQYLQVASRLKEQLLKQSGFISIERFQSLVQENKLLSLSFWEGEKDILSWKENLDHMKAQQEGRENIFMDYRIRVVEVKKDYTLQSSDFK